MTPVKHYFIQVDDVDVLQRRLSNGKILFLPRRDGDKYRSNSFHGVLAGVPEGSRLSVGETVYVNYQAIDTAEKIDGKYYYIVPEKLIVAKGELEKTAFNSLLVKPIQAERLTSSVLEIVQYDLPAVTKSEVLSSDIPGYKAGDIIVHEKDIDWEFFVNEEKFYYITMLHRIISVNDKLVNNYVEIQPLPRYKEHHGLKIPYTDPWAVGVSHPYTDHQLYIERNRVQLERYIHEDYIHAAILPSQSPISQELVAD